jgi:hypothetical protein
MENLNGNRQLGRPNCVDVGALLKLIVIGCGYIDRIQSVSGVTQ